MLNKLPGGAGAAFIVFTISVFNTSKLRLEVSNSDWPEGLVLTIFFKLHIPLKVADCWCFTSLQHLRSCQERC